MAVFIISPIMIEKNKDHTGLDYAWAIVKEGKVTRGLMVYLHRQNTGRGWGCEVHHGVDSDSMIPVSKAFRVSNYKYLRGCPTKYLLLAKALEKALRS